mgnify:FL=1
MPHHTDPTARQRTCPVTGETLRGDRYVSTTACDRLHDVATTLPALMAAVAAAKHGLRRGKAAAASTGYSSRPPARLDIIHAAATHETTITRWAERAASAADLPRPARHDWDAIAAALHAAASRPGDAALADLIPDVLTAARALTALADLPPAHRFYGRCLTEDDAGTVCDAPIYAPPDAAWARCPACRTLWELAPLLTAHLQAAADWAVTTAEGARLLTAAGHPTKPETIRLWKHRGRIAADADGRYRVGDLLAAASRRPSA